MANLHRVHSGEPMRSSDFNAIVERVEPLSVTSASGTGTVLTVSGDLEVHGHILASEPVATCPIPKVECVFSVPPPIAAGWSYDPGSAALGALLAAAFMALLWRRARSA